MSYYAPILLTGWQVSSRFGMYCEHMQPRPIFRALHAPSHYTFHSWAQPGCAQAEQTK